MGQHIFDVRKRYLRVPELGVFQLIRKRKLNNNEIVLAVYLRSKYLRFKQNQFYLFDKVILKELPSFSHSTLKRTRVSIQTKGLIEYQSGDGKGKPTLYCMLDQVMAGAWGYKTVDNSVDKSPKVVKSDIKGGQLERKGGQLEPLSNDTYNNEDKHEKNGSSFLDSPIKKTVNRILNTVSC